MAGAPSQLETFDYKPDLQKIARPGLPALAATGEALCLYSGYAEDAPVRRPNLLVTARVVPMFPIYSRTKLGWSMIWLSYALCTPRSSITRRLSC